MDFSGVWNVIEILLFAEIKYDGHNNKPAKSTKKESSK